MISQTSNEHLDELNARAQAIRQQAGELGRQGAELPGRPYRLYRGDTVQVRRTVHHPELGAVRNGTTGHLTDVGNGGQQLSLRLDDGRLIELERRQIDAADVRLAYVQHPFPSQGQTTDSAHLIVGEHATQEGSYVAITRARERTDIYASLDELESEDEPDRLTMLAESMGRSEDEVASIDIPLAHEASIEHEHESELGDPQPEKVNQPEREDVIEWEL